jgi:hypothetical protein
MPLRKLPPPKGYDISHVGQISKLAQFSLRRMKLFQFLRHNTIFQYFQSCGDIFQISDFLVLTSGNYSNFQRRTCYNHDMRIFLCRHFTYSAGLVQGNVYNTFPPTTRSSSREVHTTGDTDSNTLRPRTTMRHATKQQIQHWWTQ